MSLIPEKKQNPAVKRVIGVVSGKGGVRQIDGSPSLLAESFASRGLHVGPARCGHHGPPVYRALLGIDSFRAESDGEHLFPCRKRRRHQSTFSINLFNEKEDEPVIWRGPLLAKAIDRSGRTRSGRARLSHHRLPPGTSDVVLTSFQIIPFSGIVVVVATPQITCR
jgi:Mrp family chromosome partitioning ATPase